MTHADRLRRIGESKSLLADTHRRTNQKRASEIDDDAAACLSGARALERLQEIEKEQKEMSGREETPMLPLNAPLDRSEQPAPYVPRCGDTVLHGPSRETWIVAYVDGNELSWVGWPEGTARLSDCEVTKRCSDEQHIEAVGWFRTGANDTYRSRKVLALYGESAKALQDDPVEPSKATNESPHDPEGSCRVS
jgi:hypothetical protein